MAGIPGTLGGIVRMNAGGRFGQISDVICDVTVLDADGVRRRLSQEEVGFSYRHSELNGSIVVGATLLLRPDDAGRVRKRYNEIWEYKRASQPLADYSAGCVFKNPPGASAGSLIDRAGLKGYAVGGAYVSPQHANFILAREGARARDIFTLIGHIRRVVAERSGVELELEIQVWDQCRARQRNWFDEHNVRFTRGKGVPLMTRLAERAATGITVPKLVAKKLKITVLSGGTGGEREVSLKSGRAVAAALISLGHSVHVADITPDSLAALDIPADVVFIALHGGFGEDGRLQRVLEDRSIRYTGCGPEASAMAMDKVAAKCRFIEAEVPTPRFDVVTAGQALEAFRNWRRRRCSSRSPTAAAWTSPSRATRLL